jgi:hypothetical protein
VSVVVTRTPAGAQETSASKMDQLVLLINRARVGAGRLPLARSSELDAAANAHSLDMVRHDYLDHIGSDGSDPQERADQAGYDVPPQSGWIVVELISAISADPQGPVNWWLNESPAVHGKVLLDPRWREIGAGYAEGGRYGNYWTVEVGCRPGVVPTVSLDGVSYTHTERCGDPQAVASPTMAPSIPIPTPSPSVQVWVASSSLTLAPGSVINVQWRGIQVPATTDWVGLYRAGEADAAYVAWVYVGCAQVPLDARALGSCNVLLPTTLTAGSYEVRLFAANGYRRLGVSPPIRLAP